MTRRWTRADVLRAVKRATRTAMRATTLAGLWRAFASVTSFASPRQRHLDRRMFYAGAMLMFVLLVRSRRRGDLLIDSLHEELQIFRRDTIAELTATPPGATTKDRRRVSR